MSHLGAVNAGFDAQVKETAALTALPSLRGQEATAQDFMAERYRARGLAVDRTDDTPQPKSPPHPKTAAAASMGGRVDADQTDSWPRPAGKAPVQT